MMQTLRSRQLIAGVVVSVVTVAVIGVVLVATTSIGCGPANALALKSISKHCLNAQTAAATRTPSPSPLFIPAPIPQPYNPPASQPYNPPSSGPYPPNGNQSSPPFPPFYPPSSGPGPVIAPFTLNCRLPVYAGPPGSGGFVVFPDGTFVADSKSGVTLPSPSPGSPSPAPQPGYGQYYSALSYDFAYKKWLPAPSNAVAPDGSRYAYVSPNSIYVQDVADSTQVELGDGKVWFIVGVEADGVYAGNPNIAGLWFLPYSGSPRQITTAGYWQAEAAGFAYGTETSAVPQGVSNTILRLNLMTGASESWFTRTGASSQVSGFDRKGNLIVFVFPFSGRGPEVWIANSATTALPIMSPDMGLFANGTPIADSHGVWFAASVQDFSNGSGGGQVLYVPGSGVYLMARIGGQLAGGCN